MIHEILYGKRIQCDSCGAPLHQHICGHCGSIHQMPPSRIGVALTHPGIIGKGIAETLRDEWRRRYEGPKNWCGVLPAPDPIGGR